MAAEKERKEKKKKNIFHLPNISSLMDGGQGLRHGQTLLVSGRFACCATMPVPLLLNMWQQHVHWHAGLVAHCAWLVALSLFFPHFIPLILISSVWGRMENAMHMPPVDVWWFPSMPYT